MRALRLSAILIVMLGTTLSAVLCFAQENRSATLSGKSLSLQLNDATANEGGISVQYIFTTYDADKFSLPYSYSNDTITYSRELKKIGDKYYTDYYTVSNGKVSDYGEIELHFFITFPPFNIDLDGNDIDDICEKNLPFSAQAEGTWYSVAGRGGSIRGSAYRNANSQQGTLSLSIFNVSGIRSLTITFYIGVLSGTVDYSHADLAITFNFSTTWDRTFPFAPTTTTFEIISKNKIRVIGKDFFPTFILERTGNKYHAFVELLDGGFGTSWPDYQKWALEIEDLNDSDHDGIPDFSDLKNNPNSLSPILQLLLD